MEFGIPALLRPQVERDGREFVDQGVGEAVFCEVDGLDIGLTTVAAFDANVREGFGGVDGKLGVVFLAASRTNDAAELPFRQAETAEQAAAGAVPLLAKDAQRGFATAERTQGMSVAIKLQSGAGAGQFSVRLQEGEGQKFSGIGGRLAGGGPDGIQEIRPHGGRAAQVTRDLREAGGTVLFDDGEKLREAGQELWVYSADATVLDSAAALDGLVEVLLEVGGVDIEGEDLRGEGMLRGERLGPPDSLLPDSVGHRAIMGLGAKASNC